MRKILRYALLASVLAALLAANAGCGKMGSPRPRDASSTFTFANTVVTAAGRCLAVQGTVQGALNNMDSLDFELAPVDESANCPTCPFNARETAELSLEDIAYNVENGGFFFSYCPINTTDMYRWRLVGQNIYPGLPYSVTVPRIFVMPAE